MNNIWATGECGKHKLRFCSLLVWRTIEVLYDYQLNMVVAYHAGNYAPALPYALDFSVNIDV